MERYYEESAISQKSEKEGKIYGIFHAVSLVFAAIALVLLVFTFLQTPRILEEYTGIGIVWMLVQLIAPLVAAAGIALFCLLFKYRFNVSYDYLLVDDEVRVSKVSNGKRRKFVRRFKQDGILKIGFCARESYARTLEGRGKPVMLTVNAQPSEGKIFIYMVYSDSLGKAVYVFECREAFMQMLARIVDRNKLELQ